MHIRGPRNISRAAMHLYYYLNEEGKRVYTLKKKDPEGKPTCSAHPGTFRRFTFFCAFSWNSSFFYSTIFTGRQVFSAALHFKEKIQSSTNTTGRSCFVKIAR